jgi:hypothetical protein
MLGGVVLAGAAGIGAVLWHLARGRIGARWLAATVGVGVLTGLIAVRIAQQPDTSRSMLVKQLTAVVIAAAWWLVARGAMRDALARRDGGGRNGGGRNDRNDGGRWHIDN